MSGFEYVESYSTELYDRYTQRIMYNEHYSRVDFSACYWSIECNEAVGIQSGDVDDKDITVSSKRHDFNVLDAWCPATVNRKQYFQVNLGFKTKITKVSTQGRLGNLDRHVKSYRLYYSMDGHDWKVYQTEGVDKVGVNRRWGFSIKVALKEKSPL